ncbi:hypothetical protein FHS18_004823 [Paenibacillus phyllosphaerae]|uniref:Nuclear transport factor 2 family protein n=1 Tax=Paenibacillus phyllosphaerae TaxID=274593 RepID=A0A7W5FPT2_9BACL|nr:hypothetical protein [Paenibacillus phyllosphaerae]MBB3112721.1 hypothetical protein [Paenibacillus phyllosphaerae]
MFIPYSALIAATLAAGSGVPASSSADSSHGEHMKVENSIHLNAEDAKEIAEVTRQYFEYANAHDFKKLNTTLYPKLEVEQPGSLALYPWFDAKQNKLTLQNLTLTSSFVNSYRRQEVMGSIGYLNGSTPDGGSVAYFKMDDGWKIISFD